MYARDKSGISPFRSLFNREPNRFLDYIWSDPPVIPADMVEGEHSKTVGELDVMFDIDKT